MKNPLQKCVFFVFLFLTLILCFVFADEVSAVESNIIEFKTQAPPDPFPEAPKDCYEYVYGKLSAMRRHGATWQNGVADCSNCTCDNGDIRCFFHFCNEPSMGYMTPPTTDDETILSPPATEDDITEEESSGFPPHDITDEDTETEAEWPPRIKPEKWEKELSAFETSSAPSVGGTKADDSFSFVKEEDERHDRTENETHDIYKTYFCGKICKKSCPQGFKVDRITGCWKCRCNKCPSQITCEKKCPLGYAVDATGCDTCRCLTPSEPNNEDIVFTDEYDAKLFTNDIDNGVDEGRHIENSVSESDHLNSSSSSSSSEEDDYEDPEYEDKIESEDEVETKVEEEKESFFPFKISTLPNVRKSSTSFRKGLSSGDLEVTSFPSIRVDGFDNEEEPCNTTQLRGCLDGILKFAVGESWSRGPCVACRCVAPGYSECNITQCHALHYCPLARRFTPPGACCSICTDDTPAPGLLEKIYESRSTSRVPTELLPLKQQDNIGKEVETANEEKATITSVPRDDQSHLLLILIPMGILFSAGVLLFAHLWRRYHRDKYDINAYRPEEKQKLRPVKTLHDDNSSLGHAC